MAIQQTPFDHQVYLPLIRTSLRLITSDPVVIGAGDIAACHGKPAGQTEAALTAQLLGQVPTATVITLGDNSNEDGTPDEYANCFGPTWGVYMGRMHPSQGNHDDTIHYGAAYFAYFGRAAGPAGQGWYSYGIGSWHIVVLNGNCSEVGGCETGSSQEAWLRADLAAHRAKCTLAYWHQPRFSSGRENGSDIAYQPFWQDLYSAGAEIVLNGHDHDYERFAPQDPAGNADPAYGIREFVVGTGGVDPVGFRTILPNSGMQQSGTFGVLELGLHAGSYEWLFIPAGDTEFSDYGSGICHG